MQSLKKNCVTARVHDFPFEKLCATGVSAKSMPSMWEEVKCVPCLVLYKLLSLPGSLPSLSAPSVEMSCSPLNRTSHPSSQHLLNTLFITTTAFLHTLLHITTITVTTILHITTITVTTILHITTITVTTILHSSFHQTPSRDNALYCLILPVVGERSLRSF